MSVSKLLISALVATSAAFGASTIAAAADTHNHAATAAAPASLTLNNGRKWPTDDSLRRGMTEIRQAVADAIAPIHNNAFTPVQYTALAARVDAQIDDITANCHLPEDADQQLHLVLEQILDGVAAMKRETGQAQGAVTVIKALGQYGEFFDHVGWTPLAH